MKKYFILLLFFTSCFAEKQIAQKEYPKTIGDIEFDPAIDGNFERCGTLS